MDPKRERYFYEHIRYTVVLDKNNVLYKAIGVFDDVTGEMQMLKKCQINANLRQSLSKKIFLTALLDLINGNLSL